MTDGAWHGDAAMGHRTDHGRGYSGHFEQSPGAITSGSHIASRALQLTSFELKSLKNMYVFDDMDEAGPGSMLSPRTIVDANAIRKATHGVFSGAQDEVFHSGPSPAEGEPWAYIRTPSPCSSPLRPSRVWEEPCVDGTVAHYAWDWRTGAPHPAGCPTYGADTACAFGGVCPNTSQSGIQDTVGGQWQYTQTRQEHARVLQAKAQLNVEQRVQVNQAEADVHNMESQYQEERSRFERQIARARAALQAHNIPPDEWESPPPAADPAHVTTQQEPDTLDIKLSKLKKLLSARDDSSERVVEPDTLDIKLKKLKRLLSAGDDSLETAVVEHDSKRNSAARRAPPAKARPESACAATQHWRRSLRGLELMIQKNVDKHAVRALRKMDESDAAEVVKQARHFILRQDGRCDNVSAVLLGMCRKMRKDGERTHKRLPCQPS